MIRQPSSTFPILVRTVVAYTANDPEVATTVPYLVKSGKVRLGRIFAAARFDQSTTNISEFHLPRNGTNEPAGWPEGVSAASAPRKKPNAVPIMPFVDL